MTKIQDFKLKFFEFFEASWAMTKGATGLVVSGICWGMKYYPVSYIGIVMNHEIIMAGQPTPPNVPPQK